MFRLRRLFVLPVPLVAAGERCPACTPGWLAALREAVAALILPFLAD